MLGARRIAVLGGTNLHRPRNELIIKRNLLIMKDLCFVTPWDSTPWRFVPPSPVFFSEKACNNPFTSHPQKKRENSYESSLF